MTDRDYTVGVNVTLKVRARVRPGHLQRASACDSIRDEPDCQIRLRLSSLGRTGASKVSYKCYRFPRRLASRSFDAGIFCGFDENSTPRWQGGGINSRSNDEVLMVIIPITTARSGIIPRALAAVFIARNYAFTSLFTLIAFTCSRR